MPSRFVIQPWRRAGVLLSLCLASALLAGCAGGRFPVQDPPARFDTAGEAIAGCARFFAELDRVAADAGATDGQEARVQGFPYLRINRFLAGDWRPGPADPAFVDWARRLERLDTLARRVEFGNLNDAGRAALGRGEDSARVGQRIRDCAATLLARDLEDPAIRARLHRNATVPDDYRLAYRVVGLYPLTAIPFLAGVHRLHETIRSDFRPPLDELPVKGRLVRYRPRAAASLSAAERARILHRAADNPLELPFPGPADRDRLLRAYAPVFEVDVAGDDDRIGWPALAPGGLPRVDTSRPVVFAYLSHTRFEGESLLQLNYVIWFPARPPGGPLDILAGRLDGFNWRVTLDRDGGPLIYDSVHNCGCYHLFVPGEKVRFTGAESAFEEPALIPQSLPLAPGRLVVRVASRTHYIQRAYFGAPAGEESYALADYDRLRALDTGYGGTRSLFDANGIVPGTERGERWLFWPMGIENPGAMRQRGRQPTAFVGRRHFDDPDLFSRYFRRVDR